MDKVMIPFNVSNIQVNQLVTLKYKGKSASITVLGVTDKHIHGRRIDIPMEHQYQIDLYTYWIEHSANISTLVDSMVSL